MDSSRPSFNLQRSDLVVGDRERVIELDRAAGEIARQAGAEFHDVLTHRSFERFHNVPILRLSLLLPSLDAIDPTIFVPFVMPSGIFGKAEDRHVPLLSL